MSSPAPASLSDASSRSPSAPLLQQQQHQRGALQGAIYSKDAVAIAKYTSEARRGAAELRELASGESSAAAQTKWKQIDQLDGVKIYQQQEDASSSQRSVFKGVGIISAPLAVCVELLMDTQKKSSYDALFDKTTLVEEITPHVKIEHQCYWAPFPVSKRDFCVVLHKARLSDGTVLLLGKSTRHPLVPEKSNYVRGEILIGGWILKEVKGGGEDSSFSSPTTSTHVTFVACTDLCGSLPSLIKNQLDRKQPALVNAIKPLIAKRMKEMDKMKDQKEKEKLMKQQQELIDVLPVYDDAELELELVTKGLAKI